MLKKLSLLIFINFVIILAGIFLKKHVSIIILCVFLNDIIIFGFYFLREIMKNKS